MPAVPPHPPSTSRLPDSCCQQRDCNSLSWAPASRGRARGRRDLSLSPPVPSLCSVLLPRAPQGPRRAAGTALGILHPSRPPPARRICSKSSLPALCIPVPALLWSWAGISCSLTLSTLKLPQFCLCLGCANFRALWCAPLRGGKLGQQRCSLSGPYLNSLLLRLPQLPCFFFWYSFRVSFQPCCGADKPLLHPAPPTHLRCAPAPCWRGGRS